MHRTLATRILPVCLALLVGVAVASPALAETIYLPLVMRTGSAVPPTTTPTATATPTAPTVGTPVPTNTPAPTIAATPVAVDTAIVVQHTSTYRLSFSSDLYLVGEVLNQRISTLADNVRIDATFYDASGRVVGTAQAPAMLDGISPGGASPFRLTLPNAPSTIDRYEVRATPGSARQAIYDIGVTLQQVRNNVGPEVSGEVQNVRMIALSGVKVVASFFDATGNVVEVGSTYVNGGATLAPGDKGTFSINTYHAGVGITRVSVVVQGAATGGTAPTSVPTTNPYYTGGQDRYNCTDFATWSEADAVFQANRPGDPNRLDTDSDGVPCEALPGAP